MGALIRTAGPLLQALISTGLGILAFAAMSGAGFGLEPSLTAALILAGSLNIYALASLNSEMLLPTSPGGLGEL
ncbi:MAG TPA: hypothetical protein VII56_11340 [Rhizomicrobium sp.]